MSLSDYGKQMTRLSGVHQVTLDIEKTIATFGKSNLINLSTGNPAILPELVNLWRRETIAFAQSDDFAPEVCQYASIRGYPRFVSAVVELMNQNGDFSITDRNVLVTSGSQQACFYATNLFAGKKQNARSKVLFPISPEYSGYLNLGLSEEDLVSPKPMIEKNGPHLFKYKIGFDRICFDEVGLIILSRPCNPSGNVITNQELQELIRRSKTRDIILVIDAAYAPPIPNLCFTEMEHYLDDHVIHVMSFSKAGLPGLRVGVAVGHEKVIEPLRFFQANACIKTAIGGQALAANVLASGELVRLSNTVTKPYYQQKVEFADRCIKEYFADDVPYYVHQTEGSFFKWIWFENLPVSDIQLYQMLRDIGVIVIPGSSFFFGIKDPDWKHQYECIRISLTASDRDLEEGLRKIGATCNHLYGVTGK